MHPASTVADMSAVVVMLAPIVATPIAATLMPVVERFMAAVRCAAVASVAQAMAADIAKPTERVKLRNGRQHDAAGRFSLLESNLDRDEVTLQQISCKPMPDALYLSLWFPDFSGPAMLPHMFAVLQQFPFSDQRPGVAYVAVQPVSWNEASVLERRFSPGITPEEAVVVAADLIHDDYAYVFDAYWDLWTPDENGREWLLSPSLVKFIVQGEEFDNGASHETGHIEIDFGLDSLFVQENVELTEETEAKIRDNVAKLVEFTKKAEMNTRATSRRLWSESEESLPQKLIARLQKVQ